MTIPPCTIPLKQLLQNPARNQAMQVQALGMTLDYSHQRLDLPDLKRLFALLQPAQVPAYRAAMFAGEKINTTEDSAVLHVALRAAQQTNPPWGLQIANAVHAERARFLAYAQMLYAGQMQGARGHHITDVVHLGIGGSDLGPRMATHALAPYARGGAVHVHYLSNPDAWGVYALLQNLNPQTTLCILASKTMSTQETLCNAASVRRWQQDAGLSAQEVAQHWIAVTANPQGARQQGFAADKVFCFWRWVGGRYSVWSAVGLPLAIAIGRTNFLQFLAGAQAMDTHFYETPWPQNMPALLALIGHYNRNVLDIANHVLACYSSRLLHFTPFIQQMDMESNGKCVQRTGAPVTQNTGPVVWGGLGIDGQHAYFQLLHQGTHRTTLDFVSVCQEDTPLPLAAQHHAVLSMNMRAQASALALGRDANTSDLPAWQHYPGNHPSNLLWLQRLDPFTLGALIALYEHKIFVQGCLWNINSYDQWGVELGKQMVSELVVQQPKQ